MTGGGAQTALAVPAGGTGTATLTVGSPHVCQLPGAVLFASARSFVEPDAANQTVLRDLVAFAASGNAHSQLVLVGHTDTTGSPSTNDPLSERRAEAVHALLTGDTAAWERLFTVERWSTPELTHMVVRTGEASASDPAAVAAAVARYQGAANAAARAQLYQRYFDALLDRTGPPQITFVALAPPHFGCGKEYPLRGPSDNPSRDPALPPITGDFRPNRRVEAFFFEPVPQSLPMSCVDYPGWTLACSLATPAPPVLDWFVSSTLGKDAPGQGTQADPFRTIQFAIDYVAGLGTAGRDVIHVMDGTYDEKISLRSEIDLVADAGTVPVITATAPAQIMVCDRVRDVRLEGLTIRGTSAPGVGPAGIAILASRDVIVDRCIVTGCTAAAGGGILVDLLSEQVTISGCTVTNNYADRGGGIAIIGSAGVTIDDCTIERNTAGTIETAVTTVALDASITFEITTFIFEVGDAHGGGLYLQDSSPVTVSGACTIRENQAILFGGGIAVDNEPGFTGSIIIEGNTITCNQVAHGNLAALNAPAGTCQRADMGDPVQERLEEETLAFVAAEAVRLLHGVGQENGLGGGVALRNVTASTRLVDNQIGAAQQPNRARRGGGVECYIGAYPLIERNRIEHNLSSDDGAGVAIDQFDPFLPPGQPAFLGFTRHVMVPRQPIQLVNNRITSNRTLEDGGGLYATGGAIVEISGSDTVISDNRANENGGGVRVSYAVRLVVRGATIRGNQSNVDLFEDQGGGGLAARNSSVELEDCLFEGNVANAFAGGGIYVNSSYEGGFDAGGFIKNQYGQFDQIQELDHGFHTRRLTVRACRGAGNRAIANIVVGQVLKSSGAGGFLYAVRTDGTDGGVEALHVTIEGAGTAIGTNESDYTNALNPGGPRQKRGNVVIELSGERDSSDRPVDRVNIFGVPAVPTGIALSTSPDGRDDRAVVVIHEPRRPGSRPDDPDPALGPNAPTFPYANVGLHIADVQPRFGPEGQLISVTGAGFLDSPLTEVRVDGELANIVAASSEEIVAETPPQPPPAVLGFVDVSVINADGQSAIMPLGYEYTLLPP